MKEAILPTRIEPISATGKSTINRQEIKWLTGRDSGVEESNRDGSAVAKEIVRVSAPDMNGPTRFKGTPWENRTENAPPPPKKTHISSGQGEALYGDTTKSFIRATEGDIAGRRPEIAAIDKHLRELKAQSESQEDYYDARQPYLDQRRQLSSRQTTDRNEIRPFKRAPQQAVVFMEGMPAVAQ